MKNGTRRVVRDLVRDHVVRDHVVRRVVRDLAELWGTSAPAYTIAVGVPSTSDSRFVVLPCDREKSAACRNHIVIT